MTNRLRVELVRNAIARYEGALAGWCELEGDACASPESRREAKARAISRRREFGGQFLNMKELLEAWERGEPFPSSTEAR